MRSANVAGLVAVALLSALACAVIYFNLIVPADAFHWDEAHHATPSAWLMDDLQRSDWKAFWEHTHQQTWWPFLHSWLEAAWFLVAGAGFDSARETSLIIFFLSALLVYLIPARLHPDWGWKIGLLASLLFLTSPLMISFAAQNMLEGLGTLLYLVAAWFYVDITQSDRPRHYLLLGVTMALAVVTKYNYAYMMALAFSAVFLYQLADRLRSGAGRLPQIFHPWCFRASLVFIPVLAVTIAWFASGDPKRKIGTLHYLVDTVAGQEATIPGLWDNLLFYPRSILSDFAFSPFVGGIILAALLLPVATVKLKPFRFLYILTWVGLLASTFTIDNKMNRLAHQFMPFAFIVTAASIIFIYETWVKVQTTRPARLLAVLLVLVPVAASLPRLWDTLHGKMDMARGIRISGRGETMRDVLGFFRANVEPGEPVISGIKMSRLSPWTFRFWFHDRAAPVYTFFELDAGDPSLSQARVLLTLTLTEDSPYRPDVLDDSVNRWNRMIAQNTATGAIRLAAERNFPGIGVTAQVYRAVERDRP